MGASEPDLLEALVKSVILLVPQCRSEGLASFVDGKSLERVVDGGGEVRVVELPSAVERVDHWETGKRDAEGAYGVPDGYTANAGLLGVRAAEEKS